MNHIVVPQLGELCFTNSPSTYTPKGMPNYSWDARRKSEPLVAMRSQGSGAKANASAKLTQWVLPSSKHILSARSKTKFITPRKVTQYHMSRPYYPSSSTKRHTTTSSCQPMSVQQSTGESFSCLYSIPPPHLSRAHHTHAHMLPSPREREREERKEKEMTHSQQTILSRYSLSRNGLRIRV